MEINFSSTPKIRGEEQHKATRGWRNNTGSARSEQESFTTVSPQRRLLPWLQSAKRANPSVHGWQALGRPLAGREGIRFVLRMRDRKQGAECILGGPGDGGGACSRGKRKRSLTLGFDRSVWECLLPPSGRISCRSLTRLGVSARVLAWPFLN